MSIDHSHFAVILFVYSLELKQHAEYCPWALACCCCSVCTVCSSPSGGSPEHVFENSASETEECHCEGSGVFACFASCGESAMIEARSDGEREHRGSAAEHCRHILGRRLEGWRDTFTFLLQKWQTFYYNFFVHKQSIFSWSSSLFTTWF